jgi:hypothetical protein
VRHPRTTHDRVGLIVAALGLVVAGSVAAAARPAAAADDPAAPAQTAPAKPAQNDAKAGLLDGRSYTGPLLKQGETAGDADTVTFHDAQLHSKAFQAMGFGDTPYHAGALGAIIRFRAQAKSDTGGTLTWNGTVREDLLEATVSLSRPGAPATLYSIHARRDQAGGTGGGGR